MSVLQDGEIVLYGFVGESYWESGFTSLEVLSALAEIGRDTDVTVRMNSGGGFVHEGLAIYNALAAHKGQVTIQIESIVASSASLIAMAGDRVVMKAGSLLMIHDPAGVTFGTAEDHEKTRISLDKMADTFASIYAEKSGKDVADVRASMKTEVWFTPDEAVAEGYADESEAAKARPASAFDYRIYAHAPQRLVAMARAKNWSLEAAIPAAPAASIAPIAQNKETPMSTPTTPAAPASAAPTAADLDKAIAEAVKADRDRRSAILALDEAKGREALADHLYLTGATVEAAKATLGFAPKAEAAPAPSEAEAYEATRAQAAGLAAPAAAGTPGAKPDIAARVLANYRAATGAPAKSA